MTQYCEVSDKPTLFYKFNNTSERSIKFANSPIEVTTTTATVNSTPNFREEGFLLRYSRGYNWVNQMVFYNTLCRDYEIRPATPGEKAVHGLNHTMWIIPCWAPNFHQSFGVVPGYETIYSQQCGNPYQGNTKCVIEVKYESSLIFKTEGNCPVTYNVQCGNCADGSVKCSCGCCLPCNSIKSEIAAIRSMLRNYNG